MLVNNAGTCPTTPLFQVTVEVFTAALEAHLAGAFRTIRAFVPGMAPRGYGRVVNVSSGSGSMAGGLPGPPATVKVNAVRPGRVRTGMGGRERPAGGRGPGHRDVARDPAGLRPERRLLPRPGADPMVNR